MNRQKTISEIEHLRCGSLKKLSGGTMAEFCGGNGRGSGSVPGAEASWVEGLRIRGPSILAAFRLNSL